MPMILLANYLVTVKEEFIQLTIPELSAEPEQTFDELEKVIKNELKKFRFDISNLNQATKSQQK